MGRPAVTPKPADALVLLATAIHEGAAAPDILDARGDPVKLPKFPNAIKRIPYLSRLCVVMDAATVAV